MSSIREKLIDNIRKEIEAFPNGPKKIKFVEDCEERIQDINNDYEYEEYYEEITIRFSCCEKNAPIIIHDPPAIEFLEKRSDTINPMYSYELILYEKGSCIKSVRFRDSDLLPGLAAVYKTKEIELCDCENRVLAISQATSYPRIAMSTFKTIDRFNKQTDSRSYDNFPIPDGTVFIRYCFDVFDS